MLQQNSLVGNENLCQKIQYGCVCADVRHALAKQSHIYDLSNLRVPRAEILCLQQDCGCRFRINTVQIIHANTNHNRKGTCEKVWLNVECGTPSFLTLRVYKYK